MLLDHKQIKENFSRFCVKYDENTSIQSYCAEDLVRNSLKYSNIDSNSKVIDLGSGTGNIARFIKDFNANIDVTACDFSEEMLQYDAFSTNKICCDLLDISDNLDDEFTHIYSSFCFQWLNHDQLKMIIADLYNICSPGGVLCFSLPIFSSFAEFKYANEFSGCNFRLLDLPNKEIISEIVANSKFTKLSSSTVNYKIKYLDAIDFLKKIKSYGANYNFNNEREFLSAKKVKKIRDILFERYDNCVSWNVLNCYLLKD